MYIEQKKLVEIKNEIYYENIRKLVISSQFPAYGQSFALVSTSSGKYWRCSQRKSPSNRCILLYLTSFFLRKVLHENLWVSCLDVLCLEPIHDRLQIRWLLLLSNNLNGFWTNLLIQDVEAGAERSLTVVGNEGFHWFSELWHVVLKLLCSIKINTEISPWPYRIKNFSKPKNFSWWKEMSS